MAQAARTAHRASASARRAVRRARRAAPVRGAPVRPVGQGRRPARGAGLFVALTVALPMLAGVWGG
ncbi:hypothetical protein ACFWHW_36750, partial [Streptomyces pharetrae]|uniref:hypothetical protein n=1 Tax=Streptomyces pharetrae TaxID=291370 RepID=UPI0036469D1C